MGIVTKTERCELLGERQHTFKIHKHTMDEFWKVDLAPSKLLVRPVESDPAEPVIPVLTHDFLRNAFVEYKVREARNCRPWTKIEYNNRWDRMRDKLHRLLLRYKVIV